MKSLKNLHVMVTRPSPQGEILSERIREAGGEVFYFPVIQIVPEENPVPFFDAFDWLIFISPQAVHYAVGHLPLESKYKIAAVGLSTAEALRAKGKEVHCYPKEEWSSEGLLKTHEFQNPSGKKILLVKGVGGRELLADTLTKRGAVVSDWVVYRRQLPKMDVTPCRLLLRAHKLDIIVCTSAESIDNLVQLLSGEEQLLHTALLVVSERLKSYAVTLGFSKIILAKNAKHEVIVDTLFREKGIL